jgi:hypothetical protein
MLPRRFALAPDNLNVEFAAERKALGTAYLEHPPESLEHGQGRAAMPLPIRPRRRFGYVTLAR